MANKKISQLVGMGTAEVVSGQFVFPVGAGSSSTPYETKKVTALELATYAFTGDNQGGFPASKLSGVNKEVYFNNSDSTWGNASNTDVANFPYLQVRKSDGLLMTGSGVAFDSATVPWDLEASDDIDMQGNDITNANDILFKDSNSIIDRQTNVQDLLIKAGRDLTLSGIRHVSVKGQALDLASTPISGNVTVTGGNLEVDPGNKLIVNEIKVAKGTATNDSGNLVIEGASRHEPYNIDGFGTVYWHESNVQYDTVNTASPEFDFEGAGNGQTLTMYIENTSSSVVSTPTFISGLTDPNPILWGGTGGPPHLEPNRTNVYTFICINTRIFASAITGYVY